MMLIKDSSPGGDSESGGIAVIMFGCELGQQARDGVLLKEFFSMISRINESKPGNVGGAFLAELLQDSIKTEKYIIANP